MTIGWWLRAEMTAIRVGAATTMIRWATPSMTRVTSISQSGGRLDLIKRNQRACDQRPQQQAAKTDSRNDQPGEQAENDPDKAQKRDQKAEFDPGLGINGLHLRKDDRHLGELPGGAEAGEKQQRDLEDGGLSLGRHLRCLVLAFLGSKPSPIPEEADPVHQSMQLIQKRVRRKCGPQPGQVTFGRNEVTCRKLLFHRVSEPENRFHFS